MEYAPFAVRIWFYTIWIRQKDNWDNYETHIDMEREQISPSRYKRKN